MSDEIFRQTRKKLELDQEANGPLESVANIQKALAEELGQSASNPFMTGQNSPATSNPFMTGQNMPEIKGNIPPEVQAMMANNPSFNKNPNASRTQFTPDVAMRNIMTRPASTELTAILAKLAGEHIWEEITLPSLGKFYQNIPKTLHIRAMTGKEEQILATGRHVKKGQAIDMIFKECIKEPIDTTQLLSVDRNYILIFLRGISYTPDYDVEIKCPACGIAFSTIIDLNSIIVEACPEDFGPENLSGILPKSGLHFTYRLGKGGDEMLINNYREKKIQMFGDNSEDDSLLYRSALLIESIEGVTEKNEIQILLSKLPVNDVVHLRNLINDPPFGVDTEIDMLCPGCSGEFKVGLPLESSFFFPRKKGTKTQA